MKKKKKQKKMKENQSNDMHSYSTITNWMYEIDG